VIFGDFKLFVAVFDVDDGVGDVFIESLNLLALLVDLHIYVFCDCVNVFENTVNLINLVVTLVDHLSHNVDFLSFSVIFRNSNRLSLTLLSFY
jgi:hypothetical protein